MKQRFERGDKMREFEALGMRKFQHEISNASARYTDTHNRHQSHTSCCEAARASTARYIKFGSRIIRIVHLLAKQIGQLICHLRS